MAITVTCVIARTELRGFLQAKRKQLVAMKSKKNAENRL
jgi:hypothetical protein